MSYLCYATNEIVIGEPRVLIPSQIRKVIYIAQIKPDPRSNYLQFAGQSEGWEIVKEVAVRQSLAEEYAENHKPEIVGQKEVFYQRPRIFRPRFLPRTDDN